MKREIIRVEPLATYLDKYTASASTVTKHATLFTSQALRRSIRKPERLSEGLQEADEASLSALNRTRRMATQAIPGCGGMDACYLGGNRAWFHRPLCRRRAAILYGASVFACRRCLDLAYESREASHFRALSKAQSIHEKLGGSGIID